MLKRSILSSLLLLVPTGFLLAANESNFTYLALGDSIAFGFDPTVFLTTPNPTPALFTGYPEVVARVEHLLESKKEVNAACPGETSTSFITAGPDNGCNSPHPPNQFPFKQFPGLHTQYTGPQLTFAASQLAGNKHINLVTLSIGGNDLLLLAASCGGPQNPSFQMCVAGQLGTPTAAGPFLQAFAGNLGFILTTIRANYHGTLVLVNNYAINTDPLFTQAITGLNTVATLVGKNFGVKFADAFSAFKLASALKGGDPCASGLLIHVSPTTCDVHPSPLGRDLIAATVLFATQGDNFNAESNDDSKENDR